MKKLLPVLKILVTVILMIWVLRSVNPGKIRFHLAQFDPGQVWILLVAYWAAQMASAQRWRLFASSLAMEGSYLEFFRVYFVGMFFNLGLPSLVGGDVIKAYIVSRRKGLGLRYGLTSVLQDRAAGLLVLILYGSAAALLHPLTWRGIPLWLVYLGGWLGVVAILLLERRASLSPSQRMASKTGTATGRIFTLLVDFHNLFRQVRLTRGGILQVVLLSLVISAIPIWVVHQLCTAAAQPVGLIAIAVLVPLIEVAAMLPFTIAGLGIREWACVRTLALLGISAEVALTVGLALSALMIIRNLAGSLFLPSVPRSLRSARGLERALEAGQGGTSD